MIYPLAGFNRHNSWTRARCRWRSGRRTSSTCFLHSLSRTLTQTSRLLWLSRRNSWTRATCCWRWGRRTRRRCAMLSRSSRSAQPLLFQAAAVGQSVHSRRTLTRPRLRALRLARIWVSFPVVFSTHPGYERRPLFWASLILRRGDCARCCPTAALHCWTPTCTMRATSPRPPSPAPGSGAHFCHLRNGSKQPAARWCLGAVRQLSGFGNRVPHRKKLVFRSWYSVQACEKNDGEAEGRRGFREPAGLAHSILRFVWQVCSR